MLIGISAHPTTVVEIATGFALAMTVVVGSWSFYFGMAVIAAERAILESPLRSEFHTQSGN